MSSNGAFSKFITEFGSEEESTEKDGEAAEEVVIADNVNTKARQDATPSSGMMQVGVVFSCSTKC